MDYHFKEIEPKWRQFWALHKTFKVEEEDSKPKYYILDMFPYPSGAGLHVGHPLGYIATDILTRYKRIKGFNVLHPMGYDAFGLPAEQYAIQTGQHPAVTTEQNINRYREQLDQMGFSYDWSREVRTSDPSFYKWTQWIFLQLFDSWYDLNLDKALPLSALIDAFEKNGNSGIHACSEETELFSASDWKAFSEKKQQQLLMNYRMAFLADSFVNWCPGLGTVLANEEVKDGYSERGNFPVERKLMRQWSLRITAYAERLLTGLDGIDWPEALKEMQRNWIGRSQGASVCFQLQDKPLEIEVFTTRPDTIFGCTFLVIAPELDLVKELTTPDCRADVERYVHIASNRSERDRMSDVKTVSGAFTGSYVINPFTSKPIPVWITDYVLAGYGTGAVMAVPSGDERDFRFAKQFNLPIIPVVEGYTDQECYPGKEGRMINSGFLDGMEVPEALRRIVSEIEKKGIGKGKVQFRLRDAGFSRQRYWGEPFPIYYKDGIPYALKEEDLPLVLPDVDKYLPTETGEPPLGRAADWHTAEGYPYEMNTMPGWAGSSWYYLRYMDPHNSDVFASREKLDYWKQIDLYLGGSEHATGHLLYVRFWTKFLFDRGYISIDEPAAKLVNQGMIQGRSSFVYRLNGTNIYFSAGYYRNIEAEDDKSANGEEIKNLIRAQLGESTWAEARKGILEIQSRALYEDVLPDSDGYITETDVQIDADSFQAIHVDVNMVRNDILDVEEFRRWRPDNKDAVFILENTKYQAGHEVEKMSKSKLNVVNPDDIVIRYGADTLRMYEMFLGPLELAKPWNTNGIEGVFKFLRKFWKLFHDDAFTFSLSETEPSAEEYKSLHKIIKKVEEDLEKLSFNTSVSSFMICVNELGALKCNKRKILDPLVRVLSPFAPHITEELWEKLGHEQGSLSKASYPEFNAAYMTESSFDYPVSVNGKVKFNLNFSLDTDALALEKEILEREEVKKLLNGNAPKKVIVVKGRIINIVL